MPTELDEVSRRVMQLEIEREALRKETDSPSRERLAKLENELAGLKAEQEQLRARWEVEKQAIGRLHGLKQEIEKNKVAMATGRAGLRLEPHGGAQVRQAGATRT